MSDIVYGPVHLDSALGVLFRCFGLSLRSLQCVPATLLGAHFAFGQREQVASTGHHCMYQTSLPGATPALQASAPSIIGTYLASTALPKLPRAHSLHRHCFNQDHFLYNKGQRYYTEKSGEPQELSVKWRNSPGLEVLVRTIIYATFYLDSVGESSTQVLWPTYKVTAVCSRTIAPAHIGSKQREQAGSTGHYYKHLTSQICSSSVGQCPGHHRHLLGSSQPVKITHYT